MASPPFLPDESKPADSDIVSQFPAVERAFRDIMETWLLVDHDTAGRHAQVTLPESAGDPSNATDIGFVYTKNDGGDTELFYEDAGGNIVQVTQDGALAGGFPATTSMLFYQSAAPTGWTKDTNATLGNHAIRLMTNVAWSAGSKGATAFDSVFGSGKSSDGVTLTGGQSGTSAHSHGKGSLAVPSGGSHFHVQEVRDATSSDGKAGTRGASNPNDEVAGTTATDGAHAHSLTGSVANSSEANADDAHSHTLSLDLNYINVIRATRD